MAKYTTELVETLCENIAKGFTILEACKSVGIVKNTFYSWLNEKKDFSDSYKKAESEKLELLKQERKEKSLKGLNCLLEPFIYDEVTVIERETEQGFTREKKTVTKTIMPNVTAVIFALANDLPDHFKRTDKDPQQTTADINETETIKFEPPKLKPSF